MTSERPTQLADRLNRLAAEKSPYLLQHAANPVDWYPWGDEAFARARAEDKPVFLSVGYSTCHWCHVMAHESFEDAAVATLLNDHFIAIKVDREERPDIDRMYMTFVQSATGHGGWPMSVWLTPDGAPFYGGTYFPPQDHYGRPGFSQVLRALADAWRNDRDAVTRQGTEALESLRHYAAGSRADASALDATAIGKGFEYFWESFDETWGGFGGAPKFPRPGVLFFLHQVAAWAGPDSDIRPEALRLSAVTHRRMAEGGVHDQLGGGFHRYSVDGYWRVPHFEKMLYDQAQLAVTYADWHRLTGDADGRRVLEGILDYVARDLTSPEGGFYSAEDADSARADGGHAEGAFYLWRRDELDAVLGPENAAFAAFYYGVDTGGNAPDGADPSGELAAQNVLYRGHSLEETADHFEWTPAEAEKRLAMVRRALFAARADRPRPHLDDKIVTAWNGLMISGCCRAFQVMARPGDRDLALRAAQFVRARLYDADTRRLYRAFRNGRGAVAGFAEDYAFMIQGLLDLYEATLDAGWLAWAADLQASMDERFLDPAGGYFDSEQDDNSMVVRMKEDYDGAEPSPNSVAVLNLLRLGRMLDRSDWRSRAEETLRAFARQWRPAPQTLPQMLGALAVALRPGRQVVLAGEPGTADFDALWTEVRRLYLPDTVVLAANAAPGREWLAEQIPSLANFVPIDGKAAAYVCRNFTCQLPVTEPEALREMLAKTTTR